MLFEGVLMLGFEPPHKRGLLRKGVSLTLLATNNHDLAIMEGLL